jgi:hypothetical protein
MIHRVLEKLTTRSRPGFTTSSRHAHDKISQPVDQLQFCPRHVHDLFTTRSRQISTHDSFATASRQDQTAAVNVSRTSRKLGGSPALFLLVGMLIHRSPSPAMPCTLFILLAGGELRKQVALKTFTWSK